MATLAPPPTAFDQHLVASLASVTLDGRPHVVPLWFAWDGDAFVMYSKPDAQKVRNLRHDPRAMLALGEPGTATGVTALVEVHAELTHPTGLHPAFLRKYARPMAVVGLSGRTFAAVYSQPIRLTPVRWVDWGRPGW